MGDFFMIISALGAVILVFAIFIYHRAKKGLGKTPTVQKDYDWLYPVIGMSAVVLFLLALMLSARKSKDEESQRPVEERLRIEEFCYKGHRYIKFETSSTFDGMSVVHDPNCECHLKTDSI